MGYPFTAVATANPARRRGKRGADDVSPGVGLRYSFDTPPQARGSAERSGLDRLKAFSDGIFAIVITLLVLELHVPPGTASGDVPQALAHLVPTLLSYAVTIAVVGVFWVAHQVMFRLVAATDRNLFWLNIFFLGALSFVPFPAALLGAYPGDRFVTIFYGSTLVVVEALFLALWRYASSRARLLDADADAVAAQRITGRQTIALGIYLIGTLAAIVATPLALAIFILVPVLYLLPGRMVAISNGVERQIF